VASGHQTFIKSKTRLVSFFSAIGIGFTTFRKRERKKEREKERKKEKE
jgi:hypothetical protein